jgi:eukaryotic-like serine/threonine-protein kinase
LQETVVNNRYSILRTLGSGGMANVYLAHDEVLDRDVALKVLREQFAQDDEFVERFKREAQNAAALSHPNIVQVYDRGKAGNDASYIAMEYVPGGTLKERISWGGPLDPGVAASIALQIAEALNAAHERGVIHRDIKPQNVILTSTGDAKVADFGIARAASATTISQRSVVLGTASYMSPEQAMGEPVGPASDLYSLGVVLYEMLTGELPYTAESPVAVSMKHLNEPLHPPREVNPRIPEDLDALVVKLLAKDPEDRYASATELVEDLRRVRDGLPPVAAGPAAGVTRVGAQATKPLPATPGRRRMLWILAASLALLIVLGVGWALSQAVWDSTPEMTGRTVPDVEGLTEEQAQRKLTASGFEVVPQPRESSAADAGKVLEQSPAAGERIERGSRVVIEIGEGPPTTRVPDLAGLNVSEAKATLEEADLIAGAQRKVPSDTVAKGVIVEQGYPPGTEVEPETPVNIGVSSGPQQVVVPDASSTPSPASATASATATAPAAAGDGEEDNSGSGSDNSGPGSSGDGGD